jgi:hypothetical protein
MPSVLPTVPFTDSSLDGTGVLDHQSASAGAKLARLDASIMAFTPTGGGAMTRTALGFFTPVTAPAAASLLLASVTTSTTESVLVQSWGGGLPLNVWATARLSLVVREFTPEGFPLGAIYGPLTTIFDISAPWFLPFAAGHYLKPSTHYVQIVLPATPGRRYRVWVQSLQDVRADAFTFSQAVANCTHDFGPVFFAFF